RSEAAKFCVSHGLSFLCPPIGQSEGRDGDLLSSADTGIIQRDIARALPDCTLDDAFVICGARGAGRKAGGGRVDTEESSGARSIGHCILPCTTFGFSTT